MKYIDLFAGIGGFHYGIEKAGELIQGAERGGIQSIGDKSDIEGGNNGQPKEQGYREFKQSENTCVYANEWDKYANSVYRKHFGECDDRDIRTVDADSIPDHDLLCAGFPCQSFSIAGKRRGFEDTRGTLFFEICRILRAKRPRLVLLENVKGLLSHDAGKTFYTIIQSLDDLGYDCQWQVCNSKDFGVPQNRERIFIVGHLRGTRRPQVFPIGESYKTIDEVRTTDSKRSIRDSEKQDRWPTERRNVSNAIDTNYWKGPDAHQQRTVITQPKVRRLTPVECERLQGFPDNWTKYGVDGEISDTQRYKMCGNAVTTNVITAIAEKLL